MKNKSNIIKFPQGRTKEYSSQVDDEHHDFEAGVYFQEFLDKEDYPGLVRYCEIRARKHPNDLYAQYYLGDAYVRNGEHIKAIEFMAEHHKKYPWNLDYQYVILDSLFALGKTEDDFIWVERPVVLRMSTAIVNTCYEFLKPKRKPRSLMEIRDTFITEGYLLFSVKDLLKALLEDGRFKVDRPDSEFWAEVSVVRKKLKR